MKRFIMGFVGVSALLFASHASAAKPVGELLDEINGNACVQALKTCKDDGIGQAWKAARTGCKALRECKTTCRKEMKGNKKDNRQDKKACKKACKKGDKACKKACKKEKRAANKSDRKDKRNCKTECRKEFKTPECKGARLELVKALASCAKKAGGPCAAEVSNKLGK